MRLPDSFSFRQKPTGIFRHLLHVPVHLYRWKLGFVFGERLILLSHRGRRTGQLHRTPVEVVEHDHKTHEFIVCSGTGPAADWFMNLQRAQAEAVQVRNRSWVPVQRFLDDREAATRFEVYEAAHPKAARRLLESMGNSYDGTDAGRIAMMAVMPMIAFSDTGPSPAL